jgi:hypothetical protein
MAITFNEIASLVARFGNAVVNEEANMASTFIGKNVIKKEKQAGTVGIVNIKAGGIQSTGFLADGATLPTGANKSIAQLAYHPKALFSRLSVPRIAALTCVSKQDGVNLVKEQMATCGEDLGRTLGRAVFNTGLGMLDATAVATGAIGGTGLATLNTVDPAGYRIGAAVEGLTDVAGPTDLWGVVTDINYEPALPATGADITFQLYTTSALDPALVPVAGTLAPSVVGPPAVPPRIFGTTASGVDAMCSVMDAASAAIAAGSLGTAGNYDNIAATAAGYEFTGNDGPAAAPISLANMDLVSAKIQRRRGLGWTEVVMNSLTLNKYLNLLQSTRRFRSGDELNSTKNPATSMYQGKPVIVDENMSDDKILFFNNKDVKLAEWRNFGPDSDGKDAAMVSDTSFVYDTQMFGMYNLRITRRNGLAVYTIT